MANGQYQTASPRRFPAFRFLALLLAVGCSYASFEAWRWTCTFVENFYLVPYAKLSLSPNLSRAHYSVGRSMDSGQTFQVVTVGGMIATSANTPRAGAISTQAYSMEPQAFQGWLKQNIYGGQSLIRFAQTPFYSSLTFLVVLYGLGSFLDSQKIQLARKGVTLRGPGMITPKQFNRKTKAEQSSRESKGEGLCFELENQQNWFLQKLKPRREYIQIARDRESHHLQISGDTGAGKTAAIRQILYQIESREKEVAIVFDPDRQYIREFFHEERGDWVLNPKDDRCPYWPIGEEATDEADATPVAKGLFPDHPTAQKFFLSHTRAIFAYLLARYKPTVNELAFWMAHPEEIDRRVKGTEHEHTLTANAAPQRAGILGTLNEAGKSLRMMPTSTEGRRTWTARDYVRKREGWIFITSTPETIDALLPVQSLWLDMLILKLQSEDPRPGLARVWMVIDELASLSALPQLQTGLTKNRKFDNPIVLGFQGMSQIEANYGDKAARTILSQAFTNIILRTRESTASEHMSNLAGKAQLERIRESSPSRWSNRKQGSYSTERVMDPVVMPAEIQGLEDLCGYLVQKDSIVGLKIKRFAERVLAPGLIERIIPTAELRPLDPGATGQPVPVTPAKEEEKPPQTPKPKKAKDLAVQQTAPAAGIATLTQ